MDKMHKDGGNPDPCVHPCLTTTIKRAARRALVVTGSGPALAGASFGRWCILSLYVPVAGGAKIAGAIVQRDCPSSGGEAQGCALRSPQQIVCRRRAGSPAAVAAHKCFATLALVLPFARRRTYQLSIWAKKRAGRPKTRKRDRTSRGQSAAA